MTATITSPAVSTSTNRKLWKTGLAAGAAASVATVAFAAAADAAGVSLEVGGEEIPLIGFAQLTFVCSIIGTALAVVLNRRASNSQRTFVRTAVALTTVSFIPDAIADAPTATRIALAMTHVVAAAIVIPALAARLSD